MAKVAKVEMYAPGQAHPNSFYDELVVADRVQELRLWCAERSSYWCERLREEGLKRSLVLPPTMASCEFYEEATTDLGCYRGATHTCRFSVPYLLRYHQMFEETVAHEATHAHQRWVYADCDSHGDVFRMLLRDWLGWRDARAKADWADPVEATATAEALKRSKQLIVKAKSRLAEARAEHLRVAGGGA